MMLQALQPRRVRFVFEHFAWLEEYSRVFEPFVGKLLINTFYDLIFGSFAMELMQRACGSVDDTHSKSLFGQRQTKSARRSAPTAPPRVPSVAVTRAFRPFALLIAGRQVSKMRGGLQMSCALVVFSSNGSNLSSRR